MTRFLTLLALLLAACSTSSTTDAGPEDAGRDAMTPTDLGPDLRGDDGGCGDADGDGHRALACGGDDCDDADASRYPGNPEVCDAANHDEDCDPTTFGARDGDADGFVDALCCNASTSGAMHCGDDCNDASATVHPTQAEICNGVDDDCDGMIDDIIPGTIVCRSGDTRPCTTVCGGSGVEPCSASCLGWDACAGIEACNGCDDDNDGVIDNGFTCARASVTPCVVPVCGTMGLHSCDASCSYATCIATEICNYCDDNGDGNFYEERPLATTNTSDHFADCSGGSQPMFGPATSCSTTPTVDGFELWATLLDGTAVPQAGALWLDPAGWVQGWGTTTVDVELEVTGVTAGSMYELPLGGWALIIAHGGTIGVGAATANGLPDTVTGVGARWFWSTFDSTSSMPPYGGDSVRGFAPFPLHEMGAAPDWGLFSGDGLYGGSPGLDAPGETVYQRLRIAYTPDDPTTLANEELLQVTATASGASGSVTSPFVYHPSGAQPVGTAPLRIGITAGTYTQSGFAFDPSAVFGVPVRVRAHVFTQHDHFPPEGPTFDFPITITRNGLCR